jgi:hypothetical protein
MWKEAPSKGVLSMPKTESREWMDRLRYSLHRVRGKPKECDFCGLTLEAGWKFWRVKGGPSTFIDWLRFPNGTSKAITRHVCRILCDDCHALMGLPTDGWEEPADGRKILQAHVPAPGVAAIGEGVARA